MPTKIGEDFIREVIEGVQNGSDPTAFGKLVHEFARVSNTSFHGSSFGGITVPNAGKPLIIPVNGDSSGAHGIVRGVKITVSQKPGATRRMTDEEIQRINSELTESISNAYQRAFQDRQERNIEFLKELQAHNEAEKKFRQMIADTVEDTSDLVVICDNAIDESSIECACGDLSLVNKRIAEVEDVIREASDTSRHDDQLWHLSNSISAKKTKLAKIEAELEEATSSAQKKRLEGEKQKVQSELSKAQSDVAKTEKRIASKRKALQEAEESKDKLLIARRKLEELVANLERQKAETLEMRAKLAVVKVFVRQTDYGSVVAYVGLPANEYSDLGQMTETINRSTPYWKKVLDVIIGSKSEEEVSNFEIFDAITATEMLAKIGRMKPCEYEIDYGDGTDSIKLAFEKLCKKS